MWQTYVNAGDQVHTPQGDGQVRRVSQTQGTAQVEVDGRLYEVPLDSISKAGTPAWQSPEGGQMIKVGKRVETKGTGATGTVSEVTQRTVRVKMDKGQTYSTPKKDFYQKFKSSTSQPNVPQQPKEEPKEEQQSVEKTGDALFAMMQLKEHLEKKIDTSVDGELAELREQVKATRKLEVKVGDKTNKVEGLKHKQLEQLITYASLKLNTLLVGMAGTGKTHASEQVASALGLDFRTMSVGAQTSKSDIAGFMSASGTYVSTGFREAYEHGKLFLMDEIDAGNSNVLILINSALSNGVMAFPDKMVTKHPDFVFIASANTFGNGANRQYVGRNQLDAATLDRFSIIEWLIDDELEKNLATGLMGKAWYMAVKACRDFVAEKGIRALVTPRATQKGSKLLDAGQDLTEVINATLLGSVPDDKKADITDVATKVFDKYASEVPSQLPKQVNPEISELVR